MEPEVALLTATDLARDIVAGLYRIQETLVERMLGASEADVPALDRIGITAALCAATARELIDEPPTEDPADEALIAASEAWDVARDVHDGEALAEIEAAFSVLLDRLHALGDEEPPPDDFMFGTPGLDPRGPSPDFSPGRSVPPPAMATPGKPPALIQRIFLGTDRAPDPGAPGGFGQRAGDELILAEVEVSVPTDRKRGAAPKPGRFLIWSRKADPKKHIVLAGGPTILDEAAFLARLKAEQADGAAAFLFVHGYNSPFTNGLFRTAQLAIDLEIEGPVFHYSWPSKGNPIAYDYDTDSVGVSKEHLKTFLELIVDRAKLERLHIIAHSKGNELVLHTLRLMAEGRKTLTTGELVMASPDILARQASQIIPKIAGLFRGMTLYANAHDRPLLISRAKALGRLRAGEMMEDGAPLIVDGADSIDAGNQSFAWFGLNHDAYIAAPSLRNDIKALFAKGVRPVHDRTPSFLLRDTPRAPYWRPDED